MRLVCIGCCKRIRNGNFSSATEEKNLEILPIWALVDLAHHHGIAIADLNSEKSKHNKVNRACLTHSASRFLKVCLLHFNSVLDLQQSEHGRRLVFGF
jgi:hypothetical protein